jgi:hypothetical protein
MRFHSLGWLLDHFPGEASDSHHIPDLGGPTVKNVSAAAVSQRPHVLRGLKDVVSQVLASVRPDGSPIPLGIRTQDILSADGIHRYDHHV